MKKFIVLVAFLLVVAILLIACAGGLEQMKGTEDTTAGSDTGHPNATSAASGNEDPAGQISNAEKVQDSKYIAVAANGEFLSFDEIKKISAIYKDGYEPVVSGKEDGVREISLETDYNISQYTLYRVMRVDESKTDSERYGYTGQKPQVRRSGRKLTVDIGWWHRSNGWVKSYPVWSYILCIEDTAGTFHNYYFRVEYATDDPVGLLMEEDYKDFIQNEFWYWRALGCTFEEPEDISAWFYFYLGVGENRQLTGEESVFLADAFKQKHPNSDYNTVTDIKLPVSEINNALSILGVTAEDIQIPDRWVYYDRTDAYYFWVSDAYGVDDWSVTRVEKDGEGKVAVYWETEGAYWNTVTGEFVEGAKMVMTMQEQTDGTLCILSNVPQT